MHYTSEPNARETWSDNWSMNHKEKQKRYLELDFIVAAIFHSKLFLQGIKSSQSSKENVIETTELGEKDLIPIPSNQLIEDNIVKAPDKSGDLIYQSGY